MKRTEHGVEFSWVRVGLSGKPEPARGELSVGEVLISEATVKPKVGTGCYLSGGKWRSPYDAKVFTNPTGLDVDHMVPLAEAWRSGAWAWTPAQRMAYANDLDDPRTLLAVTAGLNRSKGDKDVAQWLPPKAQCTYISNWIAVKARFDLTVDPV